MANRQYDFLIISKVTPKIKPYGVHMHLLNCINLYYFNNIGIKFNLNGIKTQK